MTPLPRFDSNWALFLDFDGTLAEIADAPERVQVEARLGPSLRAMHEALCGAVAIISGRPIAEIDDFLDPLVLPVAGLHGLERRAPDGSIVREERRDGALTAARHGLDALARTVPGIRIEDKHLTITVHYRAAPQAAEICRRAVEQVVRGGDGGLQALEGKMVLEVKPRGTDKGTAIAAYLAEPPFTGRTAVFVGDDASDEDGFETVSRMSGRTIRVGDGARTAARQRVPAVSDVLNWLDGLSAVAGETMNRRHRDGR